MISEEGGVASPVDLPLSLLGLSAVFPDLLEAFEPCLYKY
jgi:hypothetical protein